MPLYHPQDEELLAGLAAVGATIETDSVKQCYTVKAGAHEADVSFSASRAEIIEVASKLGPKSEPVDVVA